jgi:hypothetical protein
LPVGQHRQQLHLTAVQPGSDNDRIILVAFLQGDFIDPQHPQMCKGGPLHRCPHMAVDDPQHLIVAHLFFVADILHRAIDQLQQQVRFKGLGVGTAWQTPGHLLGGRYFLGAVGHFHRLGRNRT